MKFLILPSNKLLLYLGKLSFALLPQTFLAQQYINLNSPSPHNFQTLNPNNNQPITAFYHYKTVSIYQNNDLNKFHLNSNTKQLIKPLIQQSFPKKVQVLDLYLTHQSSSGINRQCIISDKFGDLFKIHIDPLFNGNKAASQLKENLHEPVYINSNLGIPKYIKHISISKNNKNYEYLILGDQQNRIKIYNSTNPHQLLSVWYIINMCSIECHILPNLSQNTQNYPIIILLLKYYNKITLQSNIQLHYFIASTSNLQALQYPGIKIQSKLQNTYKTNWKSCKYFTTLNIIIYLNDKQQRNALLLLFLYDTKILYEVFIISKTITQQTLPIQSRITGEITIENGNWDYLYGMDTSEKNIIILAYGSDVQIPKELQIKNNISLEYNSQLSFNQFQKIVKLQLPLF